MRIESVESTYCFLERAGELLLVVRVGVSTDIPAGLVVDGGGLSTPVVATAPPAHGVQVVDVAIAGWQAIPPGSAVVVSVVASDAGGSQVATRQAEVVVAEPGWTMWMVPHFHYDPVWWNTQAAYTVRWDELPDAQTTRGDYQQAGFDLVRSHTEAARRDPDYTFVLAELDYLKPYWDVYPEERETLRRLLAEGRVELLGGTYNEPNTNLTSAESTARNAVYGIGFQRDIMGGAPETAWQLDVFGHDPQFPGMMADAGLANSSWARGPFHQWGPIRNPGGEPKDPSRMQFPSEFRWLSPSGRGLVTSYMADHYGSGWDMASATTLEEACAATYASFARLASVAATKNVLLPVGTDYSPPTQWVTEVARDWNARYAWPRFVCGLPKDFFAAVRAESHDGTALWPQTRDMNPIYTGKDVSYIDVKQAQRAAENLLCEAECFATLAGILAGSEYPSAAFDKAWRQLAYGAHHDGITGSFSDQVYLDLLTGWREAHDIATTSRSAALHVIASTVNTSRGAPADVPVVVFNPSSWPRTDTVVVPVDPGFDAAYVVDASGQALAAVAEAGGARLRFLARDVPGVGFRTFWLRRTDQPVAEWSTVDGTAAESDAYLVRLDAGRGGGIESLVHKQSGTELVVSGSLGNEFRLYDEHADHPTFGEGPWHLLPRGPVLSSADSTASVGVQSSPIGERIVARGTLASLTYTTELRLFDGTGRIDVSTTIDGFTGSDQLLRMRFAADVPGGLPVSEVGNGVIGRGLGNPDVNAAESPWTLDNPAYTWFGTGSTVRVRIGSTTRAIGVAEVVADAELMTAGGLDDVVIALGRSGVTATASSPDRERYGALDFDSNLPDVRISVGAPADNAFTDAVFAAADPGYARELRALLDRDGQARVWVPARLPLAHAFRPNADVRGPRDLPVLVVAGVDAESTQAALAALVDDLADATIDVDQPAELAAVPDGEPSLAGRSFAVLNAGTPGFVVDTTGALHLSLLRSCTGWPSAVWIDPPKRTVPDGSGFQLQHWSHTFEYAFVAGEGDWRDAGFVHSGHALNHPLTAVRAAPGVGALDPTTTLVGVSPTNVVLAALKATGNPQARGGTERPAAEDGVTLRVYEAHGRPATAEFAGSVLLEDLRAADLLEQPSADASGPPTRLGGCDIATVLATPARPAAPGAVLVRGREPVQPIYTRYWMHNKGPAPIGNLPLAVHTHPSELTTAGPFALRITAASDVVDSEIHARIRIDLPGGWTADRAEHLANLAPGAFAAFESTITPAPDAPPGLYVVAATADSPDGQAVQDLTVVSIGERYDLTNELSASIGTDAVHAPLGGRTAFDVVIGASARGPLHGEVTIISPWGTWGVVREPTQAFGLAPGGSTAVRFIAEPPVGAGESTTWLTAKVMCAGRVLYTETVPLVVS
ncbi:MAG: glycoside hydrolase family 38 C-terminal domain-containing protein [Mycobacteriales bacterium]|nr:MAG: alpha-mannosidase [Pseudonocardiales bacterium]